MPWKSREVFGKSRVPRRIKRRRFEAVTPTLADLQTKLESVRREVRNLTIMGMDPNQTTEQTALIKKLERSARAEQRLRKMALDYAKSRKT
jgi:type II secretory pathway component PulM